MLQVLMTMAGALLAPSAPGAGQASPVTNEAGQAMPAREEIERTVPLDPQALVSVSGIAGPVTVVTGGGSRAEVHIVRMAATPAELACYRTEVRGGGARLVIAHVQERTPECGTLRDRQEVRLVLPRRVDLTLTQIAGTVSIGPLDGTLRLESIARHVTVADVRSADLSSLAQGLTMTLGRIGPGGISIASVTGPIELGFHRGAGADVSISSIIGRVSTNSPVVSIQRSGNGNYRARVGAGGPAVSLSSIAGEVQLIGK
ncbi:MAG TPA: hypothetical protein VEC11_09155 [Allosphingosinicella sp.]|nr:hypothetical protein [Allosphingosinicella sp.]